MRGLKSKQIGETVPFKDYSKKTTQIFKEKRTINIDQFYQVYVTTATDY